MLEQRQDAGDRIPDAVEHREDDRGVARPAVIGRLRQQTQALGQAVEMLPAQLPLGIGPQRVDNRKIAAHPLDGVVRDHRFHAIGERVCPLPEAIPVFGRHAEQFGNHGNWKGMGKIGDEFHLVLPSGTVEQVMHNHRDS